MVLSFENPLFLIPASSGIIFMLVGFIMLKFPPKKINALYGYRTTRSMKNQESWDFSQKYSATESIKLGALLALSSFIGIMYSPDSTLAMFLGLGLMILMIVGLLIRVEKAIKTKFTNEK